MFEENHADSIKFNQLACSLVRLGWSEAFQEKMEAFHGGDCLPARVVGVRKNSFSVSQGKGDWLVTTAGKLNHHRGGLYPVAGDWVIVIGSVIHAVLPRKNALLRGAAGRRGKQEAQPMREQVIAANLDAVFVVCGLDLDFNLRRIERYVTLVYNCGLFPVIVLTKADLQSHPEAFAAEVESIAFGVPVHLISAKECIGLIPLEQYLFPGQTITMIGSSGSGKSTLLNRLYGAPVQATGTVSEHVGKGKHTTTRRDLIMMPQGAMVIDNPGIREIALWDGDDGIVHAFPDIEQLAGACRFSDCSHLHEPGCRVRHALTKGEITPGRLESYHKLKRELMYFAHREQKSPDRLEKERWKNVAMKVKSIKKSNRDGWNR